MDTSTLFVVALHSDGVYRIKTPYTGPLDPAGMDWTLSNLARQTGAIVATVRGPANTPKGTPWRHLRALKT